MKNLAIFILSIFVCFSGLAQDMEKRYFENNQELGGDVLIKSSNVKIVENEIYKTFEVESFGEGAYYLDAWIIAPITKEGYAEYKVSVNGVATGFSLKSQTDDWHSLALTDVKKSVIAVHLKKGINEISIIGKGPEVPSVEFVKLSSSLSRTGISDSKYRAFLESIASNTLYDSFDSNMMQTSSDRGTNGEIYDYAINIPVNYTTCMDFYFTSGQNLNIITLAGALSPTVYVVQFFNTDNPGSYSSVKTFATGIEQTLKVTIPTTGYYTLLVRAFNSNSPYNVAISIAGNTYINRPVTFSGFNVTSVYSTPANFYTCKLKNNGDTRLFLENLTQQVYAYNDDGGTTSDGYSWGYASRVATNLTDICYGRVFSYSSYSPSFECDLYMGLRAPKSSDRIWGLFPNLNSDNSFISAASNMNYKCYDWSVGDTVRSTWIAANDTATWSIWYETKGYTRDGATADNAAIALWTRQAGYPNGYIITHASVRKNSVIQSPHGFEWESKCGAFERVMHTRDALEDLTYYPDPGDPPYGRITCYYRPITGTVNKNLPTPESSFLVSELNQIAALINQISSNIHYGFEEKYQAWKNTWSRPKIAIHSNPYLYAESEEYESLLKYSIKFGKAVWPLLFEKLAQNDILVLNLLKDLTYGGKWFFFDEILQIPEKGKDFPTTYTVLVNYCKGLLAKEYINIQKSILNYSETKDEQLKVKISTSKNGEIMLKLNLEKDEITNIKIYTISGGLEHESNYNLSKGSQTVVINANLNKGVYVVQIMTGSKTFSQTVSI